MSKIGYSHYTIGRNFVKQTNYEQINTGRKKAAQPAKPITPMTAQELDTAYQYRQRAKREKLLRLADIQFGLDNVAPLWQNGIVDIQPVTDIKKATLYITKDLTGQSRKHPLFNRRCYFVSQGLTPCIEVNTWNGTKAQLQGVQQLLQGRAPNKHSQVNSRKAGQVEFSDYYFPTNLYPTPPVAKLRPF